MSCCCCGLVVDAFSRQGKRGIGLKPVVENSGRAFGTVLRATSLRLTHPPAAPPTPPSLTAPSLTAPPLAAPSLSAPSLTATLTPAPLKGPPPAPPTPFPVPSQGEGKSRIGPLTPQKSGGEVPEDLKKAAADLEALFLSNLFKQMRSTLPKSKLFGGGLDQEIFTSMLDEERAKAMALRGGIGLREMVIRQLHKGP